MVCHRLAGALLVLVVTAASASADDTAKPPPELAVAGRPIPLPKAFRKIEGMSRKGATTYGDTAVGCYLQVATHDLKSAKESLRLAAKKMAKTLAANKSNTVTALTKLPRGAVAFEVTRGPLITKTVLVPDRGEEPKQAYVLSCITNERERARTSAMCDTLLAPFTGSSP